MQTISGQTALVTGGAKRLGRAIALALADAGVNVVVHYNESEAEAKATADEIRAKGVKASVLQADLTTPGTAGVEPITLPHEPPAVLVLRFNDNWSPEITSGLLAHGPEMAPPAAIEFHVVASASADDTVVANELINPPSRKGWEL